MLRAQSRAVVVFDEVLIAGAGEVAGCLVDGAEGSRAIFVSLMRHYNRFHVVSKTRRLAIRRHLW
jgi:hypothetical protein